jgi:hypothetical protein
VFGKESKLKFIGWWVSFAFLCKVGLFYFLQINPYGQEGNKKGGIILGYYFRLITVLISSCIYLDSWFFNRKLKNQQPCVFAARMIRWVT